MLEAGLNVGDLAAIVLAGGRSSRLGKNKAIVKLTDVTMLENAVQAVKNADPIVVVAPKDTFECAFDGKPPGNVVRTLEDPPFGGPVAGIVAGLRAIQSGNIKRVAIVACDVPGAPEAIRRLGGQEMGVDGIVAEDHDGYAQYLLGIYSIVFLRGVCENVGSGHERSVRSFLGGGRLRHEPLSDFLTKDIDTPDDMAWVKTRDKEKYGWKRT